MAKGKMNKDVRHNGKHYAKDSMVESSDANFKMLHEAGHVDSHAAPEASGESEASEESGEESVSKKRRR